MVLLLLLPDLPYLGFFIGLGVLVFAAFLAMVLAKVSSMSERMGTMEEKMGIAAQPVWSYVLKVTAAELTHPHKKYKEMDALVAEALLEPEVPMSPEHDALLDELCDKRSQDNSPDLRPGEQEMAQVFKLARRLRKLGTESSAELTEPTVVGSQRPEAQVADPEEK